MVENNPAGPRRHRADFREIFSRKCQKKTPKMRKSEGKLNFTLFETERLSARERWAGARLCCGDVVPFIVAAKSFKEMFTSYSQLLPFCPAKRLEIRNPG
jgi:hypothetical protein